MTKRIQIVVLFVHLPVWYSHSRLSSSRRSATSSFTRGRAITSRRESQSSAATSATTRPVASCTSWDAGGRVCLFCFPPFQLVPCEQRNDGWSTNNCVFVVSSNEIYRFNMEEGRFMQSLVSEGTSLMCCDINPVHHLFACGTAEV